MLYKPGGKVMHAELFRGEGEGKITVVAGFQIADEISAIENSHTQRSQRVALEIAQLAGQDRRRAHVAALHRAPGQLGDQEHR